VSPAGRAQPDHSSTSCSSQHVSTSTQHARQHLQPSDHDTHTDCDHEEMSDNLARSQRFGDLVAATEALSSSTRDDEARTSVYQNAPKGPNSSENRQKESEVHTTQDLSYASSLPHRSPSVLQLALARRLRPSRLLSSFTDLSPDRKFRIVSAFALKIVASLHPNLSGAIQDREWAHYMIGWTLRVFSYSLKREDRYPTLSPELEASDFVRDQSVYVHFYIMRTR